MALIWSAPSVTTKSKLKVHVKLCEHLLWSDERIRMRSNLTSRRCFSFAHLPQSYLGTYHEFFYLGKLACCCPLITLGGVYLSSFAWITFKSYFYNQGYRFGSAPNRLNRKLRSESGFGWKLSVSVRFSVIKIYLFCCIIYSVYVSLFKTIFFPVPWHIFEKSLCCMPNWILYESFFHRSMELEFSWKVRKATLSCRFIWNFAAQSP